MLFTDVIEKIRNAEINWTVKDLKDAIFWDDLRDCELSECIAISTFHGYSLIKDALDRTGHTVEDLMADASKLIAAYPKSYWEEDREFAIWDAADAYVMEALAKDSRICKRAGW